MILGAKGDQTTPFFSITVTTKPHMFSEKEVLWVNSSVSVILKKQSSLAFTEEITLEKKDLPKDNMDTTIHAERAERNPVSCTQAV